MGTSVLTAMVAVGLASDCGDSRDAVETGCDPIVGGAADTAATAVVALLDDRDRLVCSGTLIGSRDGHPVVLTAAHCAGPSMVRAVVGDDYRAPTASAPVIELIPDPGFEAATGERDVALAVLDRLEGDPGTLPILHPTEDRLGVGTPLVFVGYGDTERDPENTLRNRVSGAIAAATPTLFEYDQEAGGPCVGDSGGPALVAVDGPGGALAVAGTTSHGLGGCHEGGVSARVSASYAFIRAVIPAGNPSHCTQQR